MGITQRKNPSTIPVKLPSEAGSDAHGYDLYDIHSTGSKEKRNIGDYVNISFMNKLSVAVVVTPIVLLIFHASINGFYSKFSPLTWQIKGQGQGNNNYGVHIDVKRNMGSIAYSKGPHGIKVETDFDCDDDVVSSSPIYIRIVGDALVDVPLLQVKAKTWVGSFTLPVGGKFQLQSNWVGCGNGDENENENVDDSKTERDREIQYYKFQVDEDADADVDEEQKDGLPLGRAAEYTNTSNALFTKGAWLLASNVKTDKPELITSHKYVWADPKKAAGKIEETSIYIEKNKSIVLKESVLTDTHGYGMFEKLSNYEVVCWIGSKSAETAWQTFLDMRPNLFPNQRPFKFHYYPSTSFVTPATNWDESKLQQVTPYNAFRKCKQIFVSLEEPDPLPITQKVPSQGEYRDQVVTFIKHLLNAFNEEETFPALIWMMTVNESVIHPHNCHTPILKKSTNHPCNDALKDIFHHSPFPDRVRLFDNTDLAAPMWGHGNDDINAAIALRTYVIVGNQVKIWRDAGMSGGINGLSINDVTKPNYDLIKYDWSQPLKDTSNQA